jgi:hypothetical protein
VALQIFGQSRIEGDEGAVSGEQQYDRETRWDESKTGIVQSVNMNLR